MTDFVSSTCLTLREIENELTEVTAADWFPLGVQLGISSSRLREIEMDYPRDTQRCKTEVLDFWLRNGSQISWQKLAQAVEVLGGYAAVVQKLKRKMPPMPRENLQPLGASPPNYNGIADGHQNLTFSGAINLHGETTSQQSPCNGHIGIYSKVKADPLHIQGLDVHDDELIFETRDIQGEFNSLFTKVHIFLENKEINVDTFVLFLENVPGYGGKSLFDAETSDLREAMNLTCVFRIVRKHCSWFNHLFLNDIIKTYCEGNKQLEKAYRDYCNQLQRYCKHRVKMCPLKNGFGFRGKKEKKMVVKVDREWEVIQIQQLDEVVFSIARILKVRREILKLVCAENGCVLLTLLVPSYILDALFPLTTEQEKAMREMGVLDLHCGTYHFSCQSYNLKAQLVKFSLLFHSADGHDLELFHTAGEEMLYTALNFWVHCFFHPLNSLSPEECAEGPEDDSTTIQTHVALYTDEKLEHGLGVQLEKALAKENDNKMKVMGDHKSKRAMQHVTLLHNHPAPTESTANIDNHSVEVKEDYSRVQIYEHFFEPSPAEVEERRTTNCEGGDVVNDQHKDTHDQLHSLDTRLYCTVSPLRSRSTLHIPHAVKTEALFTMDHGSAPTLMFPDGSPEPEPWFPYYQRGRDNPYTELNSQSRTSFALSSLTSGYFSTSGSVYNSTSSDNQPDSCHSVAGSRDSVTSQDIGSTLNDHHFISSTVHQSTTPTALLQQHHQGKRTNPFKRLGSIRAQLYTDETEDMEYVPYPPRRLPTYPPGDITTNMTATSRHTSSASGQQNSVMTASSEESEVSTERTRHCSGRPDEGIKRTPSEMKEKHSERKLQWLQEKVQFSECSEEVVFTSRTHYDTEREILYSGILHEHGKPRFVVLFNDMLLVLKVKKQGKSHHMEWFADQEYSMKTPMLLHFLTVQRQAKKTSAEHFSLHYQRHSRLVEISLKACSKETRDVWVHELLEAIKTCTAAHAATILKTGSKVSRKPSGRSYTKLSLTVFGARQLNLHSGDQLNHLYCGFTLGKNKCRTQAVQGWPYPMWNFKCEFSDFTRADSLHISVYSENTYQPDDLLGYVKVPLDSIPAEKLGLHVLEKQLPLEGGPGRISIRAELGWETKM